MKNEKKIYSESDLRRILRRTLLDVEKHQIAISMTSFALALKNELSLDKDKILDILVATNKYKFESLCFSELNDKLMEETGISLDIFDEA